MAIIDVELVEESQQRYLTYALSVVNGRALPDVRDGLKPVQRRILYAMREHLNLVPERPHRKSAAVVGEVLARFHPHGDEACYEAMVRMAQDFQLRYPLVDGQGNFGSLDGDSAAAYRYTEARLTAFALEVLGDLGEETVEERANFDQTTTEPIVLPSRVPNLLVNGATGIAVGMATSIPPHNLTEVVRALLLLLDDPEVSDKKIFSVIKGPDFPTGCAIASSAEEIRSAYTSGRGSIRMRATYKVEDAGRGKRHLVFTSVPFAVDKSNAVEKLAELVLSRKMSNVLDIRDESTTDVRVVVDLDSNSDPDKIAAFFFKHTPLESAFHINLTALVPTANPLTGRPVQLTLRKMLEHFVEFRIEVVRRKLEFERKKLQDRVHLLEGLMLIIDRIPKVIEIIRKSEGRADGASKLRKAFTLSEAQALFIVDLRIYQLSRTSIEDVAQELKEKSQRMRAISKILASPAALRREVASDLQRVADTYGDKRRCEIVGAVPEIEVRAEEFVQHEDVTVVVTRDGWLKRIRAQLDPAQTRLREGDEILFAKSASTRDSLAVFSSSGNVYLLRVHDLSASSGFGDPVQKVLRFGDGEQIASCLIVPRDDAGEPALEGELVLWSTHGLAFRLDASQLRETKRTGKRVMRLADSDTLRGVVQRQKEPLLVGVSQQGYGLCVSADEVPVLSGAGKGVIFQRLSKGDVLAVVQPAEKRSSFEVIVDKGTKREVHVTALTITGRSRRGDRLWKRSASVIRAQTI